MIALSGSQDYRTDERMNDRPYMYSHINEQTKIRFHIPTDGMN